MLQRRVVDIDSGVAMVITDLHGAGDIYDYLRDHFLALYEAGEAQRLIIAGDLIHGYGPEENDDSLRMLTDVMRLQNELGSDTVMMLLGNHEMPHIYGTTLAKGNMEFTARFEHALARLNVQEGSPFRRTDVTRFLRALPMYIRTRAGVLITHAGASQFVTSPEMAQALLDFDHDALLQIGDDIMHQQYPLDGIQKSAQYFEQAKQYHAITDINDPRYANLLRGEIISQTRSEYALLWEALFTRNELDDDLDDYLITLKNFLKSVSQISPYEQRVLVSGHLPVRNGHAEIGKQQLRIATYTHAMPKDSGTYLLLDCEKPVKTASDLLYSLRRTTETMRVR